MRAISQQPALLALIAVLPGLFAWWAGRGLTRLADDPVLPERLAAYQRRNGVVLVLAAGTIAVLARGSFPWTLPLLLAATYVGGFSLRKTVFGETWSLAGYLSFFGRLTVGLFGFWILLAAAPALVARAGSYDWVAGAILGGLLLIWNLRYADVVRLCLRARPLDEGPFLVRCRMLADACSLPQPRFERIDLHGGVVANALALPSFGRSAVLFTDTLLDRLSADEAAAICAHELGHLEHYNPRRLRRLNAVSIVLIVLAAIWSPVLRTVGISLSGWTTIAWLALMTTALVVRARGKQLQETACDAKAVALVGAGPLISALSHLYRIARIPRRVDLNQERSGTHPSLARRIRDIRRAAGTVPLTLDAETSFTSADGGTTATFGHATLRWNGPDAITQIVEYGHLTEMRLEARRAAAPRLVIRGRQARSWAMVLAPADAARAQAVLDVVDSRLGEAAAAPALPLRVSRLVAATAALFALVVGHVAVAAVAVLACIRLSTPLLLAAGAGAITGAATALRGAPTRFALMVALVLTLVGCVFLALAWSHRKEPHGRLTPSLAVLAVLSALGLASIAFTGLHPVRLHQGALATPAALVWLIALTGALACSPSRRAQLAAAAVVVVAAVTSTLGSPYFLDRAAADPFLIQAPPLRWVSLSDRFVDEFPVPAATSQLRISPDGRTVAALDRSEEGDVPSIFHVGRAGSPLVPLPADDVLFADDEHLLLTTSDTRGTTVQTVRLDRPREVVWRQRVDDLFAPELSVNRAQRSWQLTGWTAEEVMVRAEGPIGGPRMDLTRWPAATAGDAVVNAFTAAGPEALLVETHYGHGSITRLPLRLQLVLLSARTYRQETRYWRVQQNSRQQLGLSRLAADCHAGVLPADALACSAFDGTRTRFFGLRANGEVHGIGWIDGRFVADGNAMPGWLTGWAESTPVAIRLASSEIFRLRGRHGPVAHLSASGDRIAAMIFDDRGPIVRLFAVAAAGGHDTARR